MATIATASRTNAAPALFAGKGAVIQATALKGIASCAYMEGNARQDVIAQVKMTLGAKPKAQQIAAAKAEYVAGRVAQRIGKPGEEIAARIERARKVMAFAAPAKDGVKAKAPTKAQGGRRSIDEHKACRAADQAWSMILADTGHGTAKPQAEQDKKKRAARMAGAGGDAKGAGKGITHSELVKPDGKPHTADSAAAYLVSMAATMQLFSNKHAKVINTEMGSLVKAFKVAIDKAEALRVSVK